MALAGAAVGLERLGSGLGDVPVLGVAGCTSIAGWLAIGGGAALVARGRSAAGDGTNNPGGAVAGVAVAGAAVAEPVPTPVPTSGPRAALVPLVGTDWTGGGAGFSAGCRTVSAAGVTSPPPRTVTSATVATPTEPAAARPSNARLRRRGARADGSMVPVDDPSVVGGDATTFALGAAGAGAAFALAGRRLTVTGDAEIGFAASAWAGAALCGACPLGSGVLWTGQAGIGGR